MSDTARNLIQMTVSSVASAGLGTLTLGSTVADYLAFEAGDDGLTFTVTITETGVGQEVNTGCTYTHSGTTLTRGTLEKSTTGAAIAFSSAAIVSVTASADRGRRWNSAALDHVAGANANTTMAVGALYVVDGATLTADRTYTLPATAAVGDRIGVMMSAGSASYEVLLTAASGDTLNGIAGGTEWSRLFITGEVVIMRCVAASATWVVEVDGRIKAAVDVSANGSTTQTLTRNANNKLTTVFATENSDTASQWDHTNKQLVPRRAGVWAISLLTTVNAVATTKPMLVFLQKSGPVYVGNAPVAFGNGSAGLASGLSLTLRLAVGDVLEAYCYYEDTSTNRATSSGANENYFKAVWLGD